MKYGHLGAGGSVTQAIPLGSLARWTKLKGNWREQHYIAATEFVRPSGDDGPYRLVETRLLPLPQKPAATTAPALP